MTGRPSLVVLVLSMLVAAPARSDTDTEAAAAAASDDEQVTSEVWREPDVPLDLHWHLLALPEYAVELLFSPVGVLVATIERYRLDKRFYDLLRNDAGTIHFTPGFKIAFGDGLGVGGKLSFKQLFGADARIDFAGLYRFNADHELGSRYRHSLASADGRTLEIGVDYEVDRDLPFFGIGNEAGDVEHALRSDVVDAKISLDLTGRGVPDLTGVVEFGFRLEELSTGDDPTAPGVGSPEATVMPPLGFDEAIGFPRFRVRLQYDSRDNVGRPSRGVVTSLESTYTQDVSDAQLSAMSMKAQLSAFFPLLPERRVLHVGLGFGTSIAGRPNDEIPFHSLTTLGRKFGLRGYTKSRFRDRMALWGTVEYRFPIYDYLNTGVGLIPVFFADAGRVADDAEELFQGPIRYSYGIGLRAAHDRLLVFTLNLGRSPEGLELDFSVGKEL